MLYVIAALLLILVLATPLGLMLSGAAIRGMLYVSGYTLFLALIGVAWWLI